MERVPVVYISDILPSEAVAAALRGLGSPVRARRLDLHARRHVSPALYLVDAGSPDELAFLERAEGADGVHTAIAIGSPNRDPAAPVESDAIIGSVPTTESATFAPLLRLALENLQLRARLRDEERKTRTRRRELADLNAIGVALSSEHDLDQLYHLVLDKACLLTGADAGSLYLVEETGDGRRLRFKLSQNASLRSSQLVDQVMLLSRSSIAGYVALTGQLLRIDDAYMIPRRAPYSFNPAFDQRTGYRTRSMLTVPMITTQGEVVGVLQLINRKRRPNRPLKGTGAIGRDVIPFTRDDESLARSFASQAAVALNNRQLIESIRTLFEGFVQASVTAIESRDPTTSGHSNRVSILTVALAEAVNSSSNGSLRDICFDAEELRALRYAAVLHDFGKVGVREQVLVKANKLYDWDLKIVEGRFLAAREAVWATGQRRQLLALQRGVRPEELERIVQETESELAALARLLEVVRVANVPAVLASEIPDQLREAAEWKFTDLDGEEHRLLLPPEVEVLSIRRGSLNDAERLEIESHVEHSFRFLRQIPWTKDLRRVPEIAYRHHEKLDGTGYPNHVSGVLIPIESRMMTIADVYDALTASDRPYKRAVRADRALDILREEAERGHVDAELLEVFVERQIYALTLPDAEI